MSEAAQNMKAGTEEDDSQNRRAADNNPLTKDPLIGYELDGRYKIIEFIGSGGWGNVYRGKHLTLSTEIAVKIIHKHLSQDESSLKRLEQEAKLLSRLDSPFIVRLMDYGLKPTPYMVMEYFQAESLSQHLKNHGPLKYEQALDLFLQICEGLRCAEELGLVHRDLKPANILVKFEEGKIRSKILDFGIAKLIGEQERITATGEILGSPPYMSPEQWTGRTDHRSDIYSLGCIMYEVVSGKQAFVAEMGLDYLNKHLSGPPPPIQELTPDAVFPPVLESVIRKCLETKEIHRYQNSAELKEDLELIKSGKRLKVYSSKEKLAKQRTLAAVASLLIMLIAIIVWQNREGPLRSLVTQLNEKARSSIEKGNRKEAIAKCRQALFLAQALPKQEKARLQSLRILYGSCLSTGLIEEAEKTRQEIDKSIGRISEPELLNMERRLHYLTELRADLNAAEDLAIHALDLAGKSLGAQSLAVSTFLDQLSSILRLKGDYKEALNLQKESLAIAQDLLSADDLLIADKLNKLGYAYLANADYNMAAKSFERSLSLSQTDKTPSGEGHGISPTVIRELIVADFNKTDSRQNNLGGEFGTWEKDDKDHTQGTVIAFDPDDVFGKPSSSSLRIEYDVDSPNQSYNGVWMKLANEDFSKFDRFSFYMKGDKKAGFTRRLKIELKDQSNTPSPFYINSIADKWQEYSIPFDKFKMISDWSKMNEFVIVFEDINSRPKSGILYLDQIAVQKTNMPDRGIDKDYLQLMAFIGLGQVCLQQDKAKEALAYFQKAEEICTKDSGIDAVDTTSKIASAYAKLGQYQKSIDYYKKAIDLRIAAGSEIYPDAAYQHYDLAQVYLLLKQYDSAEENLEKALKLREKSNLKHPQVKSIYESLIKIKDLLGKEQESRVLKERFSKIASSK